MVNSFRDAGGAAVFVNWLADQFTRFKGEYMGNIAQQAMNGNVPTGTFQDYLSKKSGGRIPGAVPGTSAPKTSDNAAATGAPDTGTGAVGPTPDTSVSAAPLPPDTAPISPSTGGGLAAPSPLLQQYVLGQTA